MRSIIVAISLTLTAGLALAQSWGIFHMTVNETREIDSASVRVHDGVRVYQIRVRMSGGGWGYDRTVVTDCSARQRFELLTASDWADKPFKTVFPDTPLDKEVLHACALPARAATASETPPQFGYRHSQEAQAPAPQILAPSQLPPPPRPSVSAKPVGSGFFVSSSTVVTNHHVVEGCSALSIRVGGRSMAAKLAATDARMDLALLEVNSAVQTAPSIRGNADLGEDVMVAGFPLAGVLSADIIVAGGHVNSLAGIRNDPTLIQISAPVQPGNSGGPVFDRSGAIVGVVVSKLNVERLFRATGDIAQNVNFAIKPQMLSLFLEANHVRHVAVTRGTALDGVALASKAKAVTVQVMCIA